MFGHFLVFLSFRLRVPIAGCWSISNACLKLPGTISSWSAAEFPILSTFVFGVQLGRT